MSLSKHHKVPLTETHSSKGRKRGRKMRESITSFDARAMVNATPQPVTPVTKTKQPRIASANRILRNRMLRETLSIRTLAETPPSACELTPSELFLYRVNTGNPFPPEYRTEYETPRDILSHAINYVALAPRFDHIRHYGTQCRIVASVPYCNPACGTESQPPYKPPRQYNHATPHETDLISARRIELTLSHARALAELDRDTTLADNMARYRELSALINNHFAQALAEYLPSECNDRPTKKGCRLPCFGESVTRKQFAPNLPNSPISLCGQGFAQAVYDSQRETRIAAHRDTWLACDRVVKGFTSAKPPQPVTTPYIQPGLQLARLHAKSKTEPIYKFEKHYHEITGKWTYTEFTITERETPQPETDPQLLATLKTLRHAQNHCERQEYREYMHNPTKGNPRRDDYRLAGKILFRAIIGTASNWNTTMFQPVTEKLFNVGSKRSGRTHKVGVALADYDVTPAEMADVASASADMRLGAHEKFAESIARTTPSELEVATWLTITPDSNTGKYRVQPAMTMKGAEYQARVSHAKHPSNPSMVLSRVQAFSAREKFQALFTDSPLSE